MKSSVRLALVGVLMVCGAAQAGDLKIQFLFGGTPKAAAAIKVDKDVNVCGKHKLLNEELVVNPKNKGIANVLVFMRSTGAPVTDSYKKTAKDKVKMDNTKCRFEPHIAMVRVSQTLDLGNIDSVPHNVKLDPFNNTGINPLLPANTRLDHKFETEERIPAKVSCNIHPWMTGYVLVRDNPYMAVSDKDGNLIIKDVPAGSWEFQFWHETAGYVDKIVWKGKKSTWRRGRKKLTIGGSGLDLGKVTIPAAEFVKK